MHLLDNLALTDYRERCLKDVITQLEPGLFKKVTGLDIKDFELLVSLGVFNDALMNDAVYKFKRYEDASLSYTGINRHEGEERGGWDTVISDEDYNKMFSLQQASMSAPTPAADDVPDKPVYAAEDADEEEPAAKPAMKKSQPVKPQINSVQTVKPKQTVNNGQQLSKTSVPVFPKSTTPVSVGFRPYSPPTPVPAAPAAKPKPSVDLSRIAVGCQLRHKAFGMGTVKKIDAGIITMDFAGAEKKFVYPAAVLEGFLNVVEEK